MTNQQIAALAEQFERNVGYASRGEARNLREAALALRAWLTERERMRRLVRDDYYACTFQTMGQYRTALLKALSGADTEDQS